MYSLDSWASDTDKTRQLREQMVAGLIQTGDITDECWRQRSPQCRAMRSFHATTGQVTTKRSMRPKQSII